MYFINSLMKAILLTSNETDGLLQFLIKVKNQNVIVFVENCGKQLSLTDICS